MFINLSNHPSTAWGEKQVAEAERLGRIVDLPFPQIGPKMTREEIQSLAEDYLEQIKNYESPTVMIMGEFSFSFALITLCKKEGIRTVCATTERKTVEKRKPNGTVEKISIFEFVQYREY